MAKNLSCKQCLTNLAQSRQNLDKSQLLPLTKRSLLLLAAKFKTILGWSSGYRFKNYLDIAQDELNFVITLDVAFHIQIKEASAYSITPSIIPTTRFLGQPLVSLAMYTSKSPSKPIYTPSRHLQGLGPIFPHSKN